MWYDSFNNLRVEEDDSWHRDAIVADESVEDEALAVPIFTQVVVAAGDQETLYEKYKSISSHFEFQTNDTFEQLINESNS